MTYQINWIDKNPSVYFNGDLTIKEIIDANGELIGNKYFDDLKYQIWDFSQVVKINVTSLDMMVISALDKGASYWNRNVKVAIIAIQTSAKKLANKYIEAMKTTNWTCRLFDNPEDAKKWCIQN